MVVSFLERWRDDLRLAARGLARARGFTAAAVLTLATGIAGATTMFSFVEGVLLSPLPVPGQDRLVYAWNAIRATGARHWPFRVRDLDVIARESRTFESVAGVSYYERPSPVTVVEKEVATSLSAASVTGDFFRVVGARPAVGRVLGSSDDVAGSENALVITHRLWLRRYAGSPDVVGRRVMVGERPFVIVGVMPPDVECPNGVEVWMTLAASASTMSNPGHDAVLRDVDLIARLRSGTTLAQAEAELRGLTSLLDKDAPADAVRGLVPVVRPYKDAVVGDVQPALLLLFAAVGLVLLIASGNVANLVLLRAEARREELAVRAALGAGRGRLVRQLLAESLLLALAAGAVGLVVTWWTLRAVVAVVPDGLPRIESVRIDATVVLFSVAVSFIASALAGVTPALTVTRADPAVHLRRGGRGATSGSARATRRGLVVAQVALAVAVVAGAGLLARSLSRLETVDMGVAREHLVLVRLALPQARYADGARHLRLLEELVAGLGAVPGVAAATPVHTPPFAGTGGWDAPEFTAEGQSAAQAAANPSLNLESVHPGYFETLQVTLARGRAFTRFDRADAPRVAVVSEDLAARTWPGEDAIGRRIKFGRLDSAEPWRVVVGIARPTRYRELAAVRPTLYLPAEQFIVAADMLVLRTADSEAVAPLVRERVRAVDPDVQVTEVTPFAALLREPLARPRFNALLIGAFAVTALLLSAVGLYAVVAASVRQRDTEIGVRVALGATPADVRRLVLSEGLRLAAAGTAIGLAVTAAGSPLLRGLLYEVGPLDPLALLGTAALVTGAAALACALPARRAARADPITLLRAE